jgi:hypothetical protein
MAFSSGVHVACGYVLERQGAALLSLVTGAVTSAASSGVTAFVAPNGSPPVGIGTGNLAFEVNAAVDVFVAIGPNPNAVNGPRLLVRAGVDRPLFCQPDDKLAWVAA